MRTLTLLPLSLACLLAACATGPGGGGGAGSTAPMPLPYGSSPECLAKGLPASEPFPASAIPPAALAARQSGQVAIRYDVVNGAAANLQVIASQPPGLYDEAALRHAARYREPSRSTVRGCVMTIDVRF